MVINHSGIRNDFVRTSNLRSDLHVIVPEIASSEFWNLPHHYFCALSDLVEVASEFVSAPPGDFTRDADWQKFDCGWVNLDEKVVA